MKVEELISAVREAEEKLDESKSELYGYLKPIIKELGQELTGSIIDIDQRRDYLEIRTEWYCRNCSQYSDYRIPNSVLQAADQVQAAKDLKVQEDRKKEEVEQQKIRAQIAQLQSKLK